MSSNLPDINTLDDILNKIEFLTSSDIKKLKALKSEDRQLLILEDKDTIVEIIALIRNIGMENAYSYLRKHQSLPPSEIIRGAPIFKNYKKELFLSDTKSIRMLGNSVDGKYECPKCGSMKTETVYKQIRRSDEPMTELNQCKMCGFKWSGGDS